MSKTIHNISPCDVKTPYLQRMALINHFKQTEEIGPIIQEPDEMTLLKQTAEQGFAELSAAIDADYK